MAISLLEVFKGGRFVGRVVHLTLLNLLLVVSLGVALVPAETQPNDLLAEGNGEAITGVALKEAL